MFGRWIATTHCPFRDQPLNSKCIHSLWWVLLRLHFIVGEIPFWLRGSNFVSSWPLNHRLVLRAARTTKRWCLSLGAFRSSLRKRSNSWSPSQLVLILLLNSDIENMWFSFNTCLRVILDKLLMRIYFHSIIFFIKTLLVTIIKLLVIALFYFNLKIEYIRLIYLGSLVSHSQGWLKIWWWIKRFILFILYSLTSFYSNIRLIHCRLVWHNGACSSLLLHIFWTFIVHPLLLILVQDGHIKRFLLLANGLLLNFYCGVVFWRWHMHFYWLLHLYQFPFVKILSCFGCLLVLHVLFAALPLLFYITRYI